MIQLTSLIQVALVLIGISTGFIREGVNLVEGAAALGNLSFKFTRAGFMHEMTVGQHYRQELNMVTTTYKAIKPLVDFCYQWRTRQLTDIFASDDPAAATLRAVSEDANLFAQYTAELIIYLEEFDATNSVYNRGRLQGRVAFEVVTLAFPLRTK